MKKRLLSNIILFLPIFVILGRVLTTSVSAQNVVIEPEAGSACKSIGECINNYKCVKTGSTTRGNDIVVTIGLSTSTNCSSSVVGPVKPPIGISEFDQRNGSDATGQQIGIIFFASNLLRLFALIAGGWAMFNFFIAGYMYISAMSDAGVTEKVKEKITMTVIGLAIIAGSYILAGLIGLVMFGDASFIISPKLQGVSTEAPTKDNLYIPTGG